MKLIVNRVAFLKALNTAGKVVPSRTTKDILKNVLLIAGTNQITLIGSDSEIGLRVEVSDVVHSDAGRALLSARVQAVLTEFDTETAEFEIDASSIKIKGGGSGALSEFQFGAEDPEGFADVDTFKDEKFFNVKADDFRRLIRRTIFATDTQSTRYALGGIQVEFCQGKEVRFAATDSRRLSLDVAAFEPVASPEAPNVAPVVPSKAMKLLSAVVEESGDVSIAMGANGIAVRSGLVTVTSQFVQGRFPDWRRVMPGQPSRTIDFVVGKLLSAIRQVMVMRNEESRSVEFSFTSKRLRLSAQVNDGKKKDVFDESHIDIDCEYSGEPMKIKFDPVYFSDVLKVLDSGSIVSLALISTEDPGLLTSGRFQYVIMPVAKD